MEWDDKVKMIQLGNSMDANKTEFEKFVIDNVDKFDEQAWDMFFNLVEIIPSEMEKDIEFWRAMWSYLSKVDCNSESFGFRTGMRLALIQTICIDTLKFE